MLRRLTVSSRFRSLTSETFEGDAVLGKRTIVYGHNGSGKSALASLLLDVALGTSAVQVTLEKPDGTKSSVEVGQKTAHGLSVFTKEWVRRNLNGFLDGESADGIVTLGSEAITSAAEEKRLEDELADQKQKLASAEADLRVKAGGPIASVRAVQQSISSVLRPLDPDTFNNNRYDAPRLTHLLLHAAPEDRVTDAYDAFLASATAVAYTRLTGPTLKDVSLEELHVSISAVLQMDVDSELIEALAGHADRQSWVEAGLPLHEPGEMCLFCDGPVTADRISVLRRHFDDSRARVQKAAMGLLLELGELESTFSSFELSVKALDVEDSLTQQHQEVMDLVHAVVDTWVSHFRLLAAVVERKRDAPDIVIEESLPAVFDLADMSSLGRLVEAQNALVDSASDRRNAARTALLNIFVAENASALQVATNDEIVARSLRNDLSKNLAETSQSLDDLRAKRFSTMRIAEQLTSDLAHVYGKNHLRIVLSDDGRSYVCRRGDEIATHMSDGERSVVALIYFLRSLEGEGARPDPENHVVVIDDPSSSLDREAIFATHAWLLEVLGDKGQVIILTHDFEMMRLLLNSQKNQLDNSRSVVRRGGPGAEAAQQASAAQERNFPRAAVLDLRAGTDTSGKRTSRLLKFSDEALRYASEYHYLFERLLGAVDVEPLPEELFLLPNAARRVLETFVSFHAPDKSQFDQQLHQLTVEDRQGAYRDVYDFCNRFSHGEGRELQQFLDAETTRQNIRRCMEFLHEVAPEHFARMCKSLARPNPFESVDS